jgi:hypothetical protein
MYPILRYLTFLKLNFFFYLTYCYIKNSLFKVYILFQYPLKGTEGFNYDGLFLGVALFLHSFLHFNFFIKKHYRCSRVKKLSRVLALHLKRFKFMSNLSKYIKLTYRVVFPFELRLFQYGKFFIL